jgi:hypothetical protein
MSSPREFFCRIPALLVKDPKAAPEAKLLYLLLEAHAELASAAADACMFFRAENHGVRASYGIRGGGFCRPSVCKCGAWGSIVAPGGMSARLCDCGALLRR